MLMASVISQRIQKRTDKILRHKQVSWQIIAPMINYLLYAVSPRQRVRKLSVHLLRWFSENFWHRVDCWFVADNKAFEVWWKTHLHSGGFLQGYNSCSKSWWITDYSDWFTTLLLNMEVVMALALADHDPEAKISGTQILNLHFADDISLISEKCTP